MKQRNRCRLPNGSACVVDGVAAVEVSSPLVSSSQKRTNVPRRKPDLVSGDQVESLDLLDLQTRKPVPHPAPDRLEDTNASPILPPLRASQQTSVRRRREIGV